MKRLITLLAAGAIFLVLTGCTGQEILSAPESQTGATVEKAPASQKLTTQVAEFESSLESKAESSSRADDCGCGKHQQESSFDSAAELKAGGPVLLEGLIRDCPPTENRGNFSDVGLSTGQLAVNFTLKDTQSKEFRLSSLLAQRPVVMVFGSFT